MPVAVSDEIDAANVRPLNKEDLAPSSQNQRAGKAEAAEVTAHISSQEIFRVITFSEHIIPHQTCNLSDLQRGGSAARLSAKIGRLSLKSLG